MKTNGLRVKGDKFTIFVNKEIPFELPSLKEVTKYIGERNDIWLCMVMAHFTFKVERINAEASAPFIFQMVPSSSMEPAFGSTVKEDPVTDIKRIKWFGYSVARSGLFLKVRYKYVISAMKLPEAIRQVETKLEYSAKPHYAN